MRIFRQLFNLCLITSLPFALFALLLLAYSIRIYRTYELGTAESIMNRKDTGIEIADQSGQVFFAFDQDHFSTFVPLSDIPLFTQTAVIAAEDKNFYSHHGFSPSGLFRSIYLNYRTHDLSYGGSTISQQLVKNSFLTPDKSLQRKYYELILALKLERNFSKNQILEMYLNSAYFGEGIFGIEQAAQVYFDKSAPNLNLAESSMLAGLLPAPAVLSPLSGEITESQSRQRYVLDRMVENNFITATDRADALTTILSFNQHGTGLNHYAPHFALMVRDQLINTYGEEYVMRSGFKVTTTLNLEWQKYLEEKLPEYIATLNHVNASNGAVVVLDPRTGAVRALAGSISWFEPNWGTVNMATSPRQTGSAFKPLVYATALQQHVITPASVIADRPKTYAPNWTPQNYDGRFRGTVTARFALGNSLNIPSIEVTQQTGPSAIIALSQKLGITSFSADASHNLSIALGTEQISLLELTGAYSAFANNGSFNSPQLITQIINKKGQTVPWETAVPQEVIDPAVAYQITDILSDNTTRQITFGNTLVLPFSAAAKTGTTQDFRDAWTVGYTSELAVGIWIGNNDNSSMINLPGATGAAPLWRDLMQRFTGIPAPTRSDPPDTLVAVRVCSSSGLLLPATSSSGYIEYFVSGTEPTQYCIIPQSTTNPVTSPAPAQVPAAPASIVSHSDNNKTPET